MYISSWYENISVELLVGRRCAILKKKIISIFKKKKNPITIIIRYFAECVVVLISEYRAQLPFMIFFIFCVLSSHQ